MKTKTTKSTTKSTTKASSNGTRKAPVRTIVKRVPGTTKERYIAVLECGHRYSKGKAWPIKSLRCRACLVDGPVTKTKAAKKAATVTTAATTNGTKASTGGGT